MALSMLVREIKRRQEEARRQINPRDGWIPEDQSMINSTAACLPFRSPSRDLFARRRDQKMNELLPGGYILGQRKQGKGMLELLLNGG